MLQVVQNNMGPPLLKVLQQLRRFFRLLMRRELLILLKRWTDLFS